MEPRVRLKLFDLTMIVIGLVIGMGIFRTSRDAAGVALSPAIYFSAWLFGGLVAICGALTYAEIGSRFPATGAFYRIFSYAYHPSLAFALNISILVSNASTISAVALIGAAYIQPVFTDAPSQPLAQLIAVGAILLFLFVNMRGLRLSSTTQNILMIIKILMLLVIISAIADRELWSAENVPLFTGNNHEFSEILASFGVALVAVSFSYGGYQQTINFGSEVERPQKSTPRGIFIGITTIIVLYLLTNISYYLVIGFNGMKTSSEIAYLVVQKMFGDTGAMVFSFCLFLSVLAYVNVNLLSNPRVMYAMSMDGVLPKRFADKDEKHGVYTFSLIVYGLVSILVVFFAETFERILSFSIFLDCFGLASSASTIFILRRRTRELDGKVYKIKFYPFVPLLFIASYVFIGVVISINTPLIALTGMAVLIFSAVAYFLVVKKK